MPCGFGNQVRDGMRVAQPPEPTVGNNPLCPPAHREFHEDPTQRMDQTTVDYPTRRDMQPVSFFSQYFQIWIMGSGLWLLGLGTYLDGLCGPCGAEGCRRGCLPEEEPVYSVTQS